MTHIANWLEDNWINYALRNDPDTWVPPATTYLALYTVTPDDTGGGTEVSTGGYARLAITWADPAGGGATNNTNEMTFTASGASWGTIVAISVMSAVTLGSFMLWGPLTTSRTINDGESLVVAAAALTFTLD